MILYAMCGYASTLKLVLAVVGHGLSVPRLVLVVSQLCLKPSKYL